jgi:hypothetical protein
MCLMMFFLFCKFCSPRSVSGEETDSIYFSAHIIKPLIHTWTRLLSTHLRILLEKSGTDSLQCEESAVCWVRSILALITVEEENMSEDEKKGEFYCIMCMCA